MGWWQNECGVLFEECCPKEIARAGDPADGVDWDSRFGKAHPHRANPYPGWVGDESGLRKGATFSMKHSLNQMLHLRPHNRFEDVDGIYLTGGGTHPGSGLPVIFQ